MKGRFFWLSMTALLSLSLAACSSGNNGESAATEKEAVVVEVMKLKSEPLEAEYTLSGTLQPTHSATIVFQAAGEVKQAMVEVGDRVKAGDVLVVLDDEPSRLQLEQAQAGVAQAQGQLSAAKAGLASAEAQVNSAQANLNGVEKGASEQQRALVENQVKQAEDAYAKVKADAERFQNLYAEGLISMDDYEKTQIQLKNTENALDSAKKQLEEVTNGATEEQRQAAKSMLEQARAGKQSAMAAATQAEAGVKNAQVVLKQAQLALSKTKLTSTVSGTVLEKMVVVGQAAGAGSPAYTIGETDVLKVFLSVPDREIASWKAGQKVDLALGDETRTGTVDLVHPRTNAGTGSISVEVSIPNPNKDWLPGQVVKGGLQVSGEQAVLVPAEAVISNGQEPYVFRVVDGKSVKTPVELGAEISNNRFRIISGLQAGDTIVSVGAEGLFDGYAVTTAEAGQ